MRRPHNMKILETARSGRWEDRVYYMRGGKLCRRRYVKPTRRRIGATARARGALGAMSKWWRDLLTEEQRLAWIAYAAKVQSHPRLGQSGPLTGEQYFVGTNSARAGIGRELLLWPPERVEFGPNPVEGLSISWENGRMRMAVRVVGAVVEDIMVFGAAPCSAGRKKWRHGGLTWGCCRRRREGRATSRSCMWQGMGNRRSGNGCLSGPGSR
jgi:hypothetical protein